MTITPTPCFPSEVWLAIFDWATFVPFALDTHAPDPFGYPGTPSQDVIQKGIRESLCTKRHLVLVCRRWKALAARFLYQAIVITCWETSEKLLCAICTESVGEEISNCLDTRKANGQWVERIDVLSPPESPLPKDFFTRLLGSTPNLQILAVAPYRNCFNEISALFNALAAKVAPSLRVLDLASRAHDLRVLPIPEALNGRPLRVLTILSRDREEDVGERMLDLPNIEHLDIPSRWTEALLAACDVPSSLVSLSLIDKWSSTKRLAGEQLSIARNGIDTLIVDDVSSQSWSTISSEMLMHRIAVVFPNLRCLIVHMHFVYFPFAEYIPPVKKLGLTLHTSGWSIGDERVQQWETLCATIERLVSMTPTVEVVRLFHRVSSADFILGYDDVVNVVRRALITLLLKHRVRFEDLDGKLLHAHVLEGRGEECL